MRFALVLTALAGVAAAQVTNPTVQPVPAQPGEGMPVYRVTVVSRTAHAINYRHRSGATKIDFRGTALLPEARGEAKVESKQGYIEIEVEFDNLKPATRFGPEYLTYVMWAISPEGRATNLGEVLLNGTKSKLDVTTELQAFGLLVTAEPYFAVMQPSDVVVMENVVRPDTRGRVEVIDAKYELLQRGQYKFDPAGPSVTLSGAHPLDLLEARNAVRIARLAAADRYAQDTFARAQSLLTQAEDYTARKQRKPASQVAREAVQTAEDSRAIAVKRETEQRLNAERQAAAEREARAKAEAETAARQRAEAEARQRVEAERRALAEQERLAAERAKAEANQAAERARREREAAETARLQALQEQQRLQGEADRARQQAQEADRLRQQSEQQQAEMRKQLLQQLNAVLETRDTARGLIVNMSDVLFDTARWTLKPGAREKLAKISGIVLGHPGLKLEIEGHTDSVGGDAYNQRLSEQRAESVREYLIQQGVASNAVTARGFGEANPVASNATPAGRQMNRRVELVVSGDVIGQQFGAATRQSQ